MQLVFANRRLFYPKAAVLSMAFYKKIVEVFIFVKMTKMRDCSERKIIILPKAAWNEEKRNAKRHTDLRRNETMNKNTQNK